MDKATAIQNAVWAALDPQPQDGKEVFSGPPYGFGEAQMLGFLQDVKNNLKPSWVFADQNVSVDDCMGWSINYFCQAIVDDVTAAPAGS